MKGANRGGTAFTIQQRRGSHGKEETISIDRKTQSSVQCSHSLLTLSERELAAFLPAVNGVFGSDEAQQAVEEWMQKQFGSDRLAARGNRSGLASGHARGCCLPCYQDHQRDHE